MEETHVNIGRKYSEAQDGTVDAKAVRLNLCYTSMQPYYSIPRYQYAALLSPVNG